MAVVIAALLPVFLLIVLGFVLKRSLMRLETQWHGLERLTYYVLFPMLLIQTLVKADLTKVPVAGVGGALLLSALADVAVVPGAAAPARALRRRRPGLHLDLPGRDALADLCGARRLRQSLRRYRAGAGFGGDGRDHPAGQRVQRRRARALRLAGKAVGPRNRHDGGAQSPDLGLRDRACAQRHPPSAAENLARGRRRARPLLARHRPAGHRRRPASRRPVSPEPGGVSRGVPQAGPDAPDRDGARALVRAFRLQPRDRRGLLGGTASSSAYVLARQMGGDAPLLAQIITLQTILAAITMPIAIAITTNGS